jgi:hypothetical protein
MMKKLTAVTVLVIWAFMANAQSEKYMKAMSDKVNALDTVRGLPGWQGLANTFERIAEAEKTQWLPYYYSALGHVMSGYMMQQPGAGSTGNSTQIDLLADKAETLLSKAEGLEKDNADIFCVKKMIATLRMGVDPMTRWQTYGPKAAEALARAKALDASNPRVYLLEGQDMFYTPEQFGGSKTKAKLLFDESEKKFEAQKPQSAIHPHWGLNQVKYFQSLIK